MPQTTPDHIFVPKNTPTKKLSCIISPSKLPEELLVFNGTQYNQAINNRLRAKISNFNSGNTSDDGDTDDNLSEDGLIPVQQVSTKEFLANELAQIKIAHINTLSEVETKHKNTLSEVETKYNNTLKEVETKHEETLSEVETKHKNTLSEVETKHNNTLSEVETKHKNTLSEVETKHKNTLSEVETKYNNTLSEVETKHEETLKEVRSYSIKLAIRFPKDTSMINANGNTDVYEQLCNIALLQDDENKYTTAIEKFKVSELMNAACKEKIFTTTDDIGQTLKQRTSFLLNKNSSTRDKKTDLKRKDIPSSSQTNLPGKKVKQEKNMK